MAALYVDEKGPYPKMPGVDCWTELRDARLYDGPHPVVAHPPCGPWGRLKAFCRNQPKELGPIAVVQVRMCGGVLEHPAASGLFRHCGMPWPGEPADAFGGWTVQVNQCDWGHKTQKPTWLYVVGVPRESVDFTREPREPTHTVGMARCWRPGTNKPTSRKKLPECSKLARRLTPPEFAEFMVELARRVAQ